MPRAQVTFKDIDLTVSAPAGTRIIELSEKVGSGIVYGCREGDCGTCLCKVLDGEENLSAPSEVEQKLLREHFAGKQQRIACQAQILGDVTLKPA
ncbi:MAG: (2Fe-2S)-binding protein [Halorhodospira halophila]|uniref:2Fe-2S iron-sulfur cluster-binding protein n=1 Tax=Halorhodospira TaxID=85108 RepID=UPI0019120D65|nr:MULTISPECIES: 2Fe-2S iron-sulfur cluster-binding protein [Halorhodospira]MBK5937204.1 ferredoxin [Halorhodospira halophila]MBK5942600.1 ferredoxin [Halorhodospira halophila]MCC3751272.1 (2Fe-2S)-binding protein [Halorhodospira halophila]MCG5529026.1 (2Fe-2S)-binding protein [Halorhodospira halophila]MCG5533080.1 (2Fe-2S)-binding protein [Halorhodospira sp. 9621]